MPRVTILAHFASALLAQNVYNGRPPHIEPTPPPLPKVLHFCALHCFTFTLENRQFTNHINLPGQHDEKRVFAVEALRANRSSPYGTHLAQIEEQAHKY